MIEVSQEAAPDGREPGGRGRDHRMMGCPTLDEVLGAEDEWGLLDVAPLQANTGGSELAEVTECVRAFVEANGRPPDRNDGRPFAERLLATKAHRLAAEDPTLGALLQPVDAQAPEKLDDILDDELLEDDPIFALKTSPHASRPKHRTISAAVSLALISNGSAPCSKPPLPISRQRAAWPVHSRGNRRSTPDNSSSSAAKRPMLQKPASRSATRPETTTGG